MGESEERGAIYPLTTMKLWDEIETTDPRYTKKMSMGAKLTSINGEYQMKRMTEQFGPCGLGWGFDIKSSDMVDCGLIDGEESMGQGLLHTMHIDLWYRSPEGPLSLGPGTPTVVEKEKCYITGIGHTPFRYGASRDGQRYPMTDMEYEKKSLTDALTNAMAKLGMAADVRMGMFDIPDYVKGLYDDIAVEEAGDTEAEVVTQRHEFEDWFKTHIELIETAGSIREMEILYKGARPRVERQGTAKQKDTHRTAKDVRFRELAGPKT